MAAGGLDFREEYHRHFTERSNSLARYHVGIDVGKRHHHACVHDTEEDTYSKIFSFSVDRPGFEAFLSFLASFGAKEELLLGLEESGPYGLTLKNFLLEQGYQVVSLNPYHASQFRQAQGKKAKTDRVDARSLAAFLAVGSYQRQCLEDPLLQNLRELTRLRVDLLQDRTRQVNRLKETLTIAFPELGSQLGSLNSPTALALLATYPGPQALVAAKVEAVSKCLKENSHHRLGRVQAEAILNVAGTTVGLLTRQEALSLKLEVLAQGILDLNKQLDRVEAVIEELFQQLSYSLSDFPVGGVQSLACLLSEIGDIQRFPSLKQFLSHFGWCPKTRQSGGFRLEHPRMSHAGNPYVRRMVWLLAVRSVRLVPVYRDYFQKRTAAGKKKMHSLVAVGRKILSAIYAILKKGCESDLTQVVPGQLASVGT